MSDASERSYTCEWCGEHFIKSDMATDKLCATCGEQIECKQCGQTFAALDMHEDGITCYDCHERGQRE